MFWVGGVLTGVDEPYFGLLEASSIDNIQVVNSTMWQRAMSQILQAAPIRAVSGEEGEALGELQQLEHSVNIRVDGAQHDFDRFRFGQSSQLFQGPDRIPINADRKSTRLNSSH